MIKDAASASAVSACATETAGTASTHTTRACLSCGEKRARRGLDFLIAAAAATAVLYMALVCHQTLLLSKISSNRKLSAKGKVSEEGCPPEYNDREYPSYNDNFKDFKPQVPLSNSSEVSRGPSRRANLLSDCYRDKDSIPIFEYVRTENNSSFEGPGHMGYVTESSQPRHYACKNPSKRLRCPESRIVPGKEGRESLNSSSIGCYPSYETFEKTFDNDTKQNGEPKKLSCPLYSERELLPTRNGGHAKPPLHCVSNRTCNENQTMVVTTADSNDTAEITIGGAVYNTSGRGLYKVACRTESQLIKQFAKQDINSMIQKINEYIKYRYESMTQAIAKYDAKHLEMEIQKQNQKIDKLFQARGNLALQQDLKNAWYGNGTTDWELRKVMYSLKRTKNKLSREVKHLLAKLKAASDEIGGNKRLDALRIAAGDKDRNIKLLHIARLARDQACDALDYNGIIVSSLSDEHERRAEKLAEEQPKIVAGLPMHTRYLLWRRAAGHTAKQCIVYAARNINEQGPAPAEAQVHLEEAIEQMQRADSDPDVSRLLKEHEQIINPSCTQTTHLPIGFIVVPVVLVSLIMALVFISWWRTRKYAARQRSEQGSQPDLWARPNTSDITLNRQDSS